MATPEGLELEAVIGFSGKIKHSLILHPNDTHIIYPLGSTVVVKNVEDTTDQVFLQGHSDRVTCIAMTKDGSMLASGQITHMGYLAEIILWDISGLCDGSGHPRSPAAHRSTSRTGASAGASRGGRTSTRGA